VIVHGTDDEVAPFDDSVKLSCTGTPSKIHFYQMPGDDHALSRSLNPETLTEYVQKAIELSRK